ncbi:uncharacterized protein LOC124845398 [Vigna umbellata]|uniref:uncharacterized protein LOC124845398 n=1 Tax=Vigna umbellata TaxID=87088 RepID=UPI001F5FB9A3|nr:uncharacterized protein LOC124845398 [Vigna umbellata]
MNSVGGTVESFNSTGKGKQNFENSKIRSGAIIRNPHPGSVSSVGGTLCSFLQDGDGDQSFAGADIQSGVQELNNEKDEDGTKDLWAQLQKIGVEDDSLGVVYWYLFNNPTALKGFNGVPIHERKNMLPIIVPNYQPKGSNRNVKIT